MEEEPGDDPTDDLSPDSLMFFEIGTEGSEWLRLLFRGQTVNSKTHVAIKKGLWRILTTEVSEVMFVVLGGFIWYSLRHTNSTSVGWCSSASPHEVGRGTGRRSETSICDLLRPAPLERPYC